MTIEKRSIAKCVILSFVTCGIYALYWVFKMARESANVNDKDSDTVSEILIIFLPFLGFYLAEKNLAEGCARKGIAHKDNSVLYLVLGLIAPIIDMVLMQSDLNQIADAPVAPAQAAYTPSYAPVADEPIVQEVTPEQAPVVDAAPAATEADALRNALNNLDKDI